MIEFPILSQLQDFFIYKYPIHEWFPDVFWTTNSSTEPGGHRIIGDEDFKEWQGRTRHDGTRHHFSRNLRGSQGKHIRYIRYIRRWGKKHIRYIKKKWCRPSHNTWNFYKFIKFQACIALTNILWGRQFHFGLCGTQKYEADSNPKCVHCGLEISHHSVTTRHANILWKCTENCTNAQFGRHLKLDKGARSMREAFGGVFRERESDGWMDGWMDRYMLCEIYDIW